MSELHVIATVFNPANYASRYRLYREFVGHMASRAVRLHTVELATADQHFAVTEEGRAEHVRLRTNHRLWYKENLVNIVARRLPPDWRHIAWIDADVAFLRPDWAEATLAALARHRVVQMFTHVVDLGPDYAPVNMQDGLAYLAHRDGIRYQPPGQPGYSWAMRRETFEALGGLIDWSILGSNDYFMGLALLGALTPQATRVPGSAYADMLLAWQARCERHVRRDVGFVENTLVHYWHGRRSDRRYGERWKVLVEHHFDPTVDLVRDKDGLLGFSGNNPALEAAIAGYFSTRNEDLTER